MTNAIDKKAPITIDTLKRCHRGIIENGRIVGDQELMASVEWKAYVVNFYNCENCIEKLNKDILKYRG